VQAASAEGTFGGSHAEGTFGVRPSPEAPSAA